MQFVNLVIYALAGALVTANDDANEGGRGLRANLGPSKAVGDTHAGIGEACTAANLSPRSRVAKLCKDLGPDGFNVSLDDAITLTEGAGRAAPAGALPAIRMRELLEAADPEAAFDTLMGTGTTRDQRRLIMDYGWCSSSLGFITGISEDTSNYCDPSQECDSLAGGCGGGLSSCCITHDQCLNGPNSETGSNRRCQLVNCKGATCDGNLSTCAWNVSCCSPFWRCDRSCVAMSSTISAGFGVGSMSPQADYNKGGSDADAVCRTH